jgi:hypothetical protein
MSTLQVPGPLELKLAFIQNDVMAELHTIARFHVRPSARVRSG